MTILFTSKQEEFILSRKPMSIFGGDRGSGRTTAICYQLILRAMALKGHYIYLWPKWGTMRSTYSIDCLMCMLQCSEIKHKIRGNDILMPNGSVIQPRGKPGYKRERAFSEYCDGVAIDEIQYLKLDTVNYLCEIVSKGGWMSLTYSDTPVSIHKANNTYFAESQAWVKVMTENPCCHHVRATSLGRNGFLPLRFAEDFASVSEHFTAPKDSGKLVL